MVLPADWSQTGHLDLLGVATCGNRLMATVAFHVAALRRYLDAIVRQQLHPNLEARWYSGWKDQVQLREDGCQSLAWCSPEFLVVASWDSRQRNHREHPEQTLGSTERHQSLGSAHMPALESHADARAMLDRAITAAGAHAAPAST